MIVRQDLLYMLISRYVEINLERKPVWEVSAVANTCVSTVCMADCILGKLLRPEITQKNIELSPFISVFLNGPEAIQEKMKISKNRLN